MNATRGRILVVLGIGVFIGAVDLTVATTLLRSIIADLEIPLPDGFDRAAWIVNAYLVAYVAVMPIAGRLSDIWGRRPVIIAALVLFAAGSAGALAASTLGPFVAARVVAAVGGGAIVPVALATVADLYPERRGRALGSLLAVETLGYVWGPLLGAMLVRYLDWSWHFAANLPIAAIALGLSSWALRGLPRPAARRSLDAPGAATLSIALIAIVVGLLQSGRIASAGDLAGIADAPRGFAWPLFVIGGAAAIAFVLLERRSADPLVSPDILGRRNVSVSLGTNLVVGSVLAVALVNVPLFVNLVVETNVRDAALTSGLVLTALTATMVASAPIGGWLADRASYRLPVAMGATLLVLGFALMTRAWDDAVTAGTMAVHLVLLGSGFGLVIAPLSASVIDSVSEPDRGVGASLVLISRLVGLSLGLAGVTAWALTRFDTLRRDLDLPPITDPGYGDALDAAQRTLSATVLAETFAVCAAIAAVAFVLGLALRGRSGDR